MNLPEHVIMVPGHLKYEFWKRGYSTWSSPDHVTDRKLSYNVKFKNKI